MSYSESQRLILFGEEELREGRAESARSCFRKAAELQWQFVQSTPPERARSRSVYGLSAATLFYRADDLDTAERLACTLLSSHSTEAYSQGRLRELLARIWNQRFMHSRGSQITDPLTLVFSDGDIGWGMAPPDAIHSRVSSAWSLTRRMVDFKTNTVLARQPTSQLEERYDLWETQPLPGSYRVDLYLSPRIQVPLPFDDQPNIPSPDEVVGSVLDFVRATLEAEPQAMTQIVPDSSYRDAMVRLVRNMIPDGRSVRSLKLGRGTTDSDATVSLGAHQRAHITSLIRESSLANGAISPAGAVVSSTAVSDRPTQRGVLRAVDLDERKLRLDKSDGTAVDFRLPSEILDDSIGPLLNREVEVTWLLPARGKKLVVQDIEMAAA